MLGMLACVSTKPAKRGKMPIEGFHARAQAESKVDACRAMPGVIDGTSSSAWERIQETKAWPLNVARAA
jgi:hypothetical protein